jgi:hypothetical protein
LLLLRDDDDSFNEASCCKLELVTLNVFFLVK